MWNGEGFPPVGTVCEFLCDEVWLKGEFLGEEDGIGVIRPSNNRIDRVFVDVKSIHPIKHDWNGKGFPPAGIKCEVLYHNKLVPCHVIGMDDLGNCVVRHDMEYLATQLTEHFRPLRTERQIAQQEMAEIYKANSTASLVELFGLIYDAGYRK